MKVYKGRYGPYVSDGENNASLDKGDDPEDLTVEQAVAMLAEAAKRPKKKRGRKAPAKKTTKKKTAKKKTTKKKTTKKKVTKKAPVPSAAESDT